ncbi:MAG TPA: AraC family transcriptional regulator [Burkholderiaceae bacterium]
MQLKDFPLPVFYLRQVAAQIHHIGADVGGWLASVKLTESQLDDPSLIIPYTVLRRLIVDAMRITNEPALGLLVGDRLAANTHGILGYAAMNSGTIRQAVELLERYLRVRTSLVMLRHEVRGELVNIVFEEFYPLGDIRRPVLEAVSLTIKNLLDHINGGAALVRQVAFPFEAPAYAALARDLFKCEVLYAQPWTGFALPLNAIDKPLKMADPATFQDAVGICQRELDKLTRDESLGAQVRRSMLQRQGKFPSLGATARMFHSTPRTLHRRLLHEGTSYKEILEDVRHLLAVEYLKAGHLNIQEIAYTLGYTDAANFRRAFKRWESVAPSAYRSPDSG